MYKCQKTKQSVNSDNSHNSKVMSMGNLCALHLGETINKSNNATTKEL